MKVYPDTRNIEFLLDKDQDELREIIEVNEDLAFNIIRAYVCEDTKTFLDEMAEIVEDLNEQCLDSIEGMKLCPRCQGSGGGLPPMTCPSCGGSGQRGKF